MEINTRQLAELVETKYKQRDWNLRTSGMCGFKLVPSDKTAYVKCLDKTIKQEININIKQLVFNKNNVLQAFKDILMDGTHRRSLNSLTPGEDVKSCKNRSMIYSIAYIKRVVFGFKDWETHKHKLFRTYLVELELEGKIKTIRNSAGSIVGLELLERKISPAEQLMKQLKEKGRVAKHMQCGPREISKFQGRWDDKNKKYSIEFDTEIHLDSQDPEKFFLIIEKSTCNENRFIEKYLSEIEASNFFKSVGDVVKPIALTIINDIKENTDANLTFIDDYPTINKDNHIGYWIKF